MVKAILGNLMRFLDKEPAVLLAKNWTGHENVGEIKKAIARFDLSMDTKTWRIFDAYCDYKGGTEASNMSKIFDRSLIDLSDFCSQTRSAGFRPTEVVQALSDWLTIADKASLLMDSEQEPEDREADAGDAKSTLANAKKSKAKKKADSEDAPVQAPEIKESDLEEDVAKGMDVYDVEVDIETTTTPEDDGDVISEGFHGYSPANVNNSFHRGFLYYPVQTIIAKMEEVKGQHRLAEKIETVVIRSDRTMQRIVKSERLTEGDVGHDVLRLTDGTLIHTPPKPNNHGTWKWDYIESFLEGETETPPIKDCLEIIHQHLRSRIWLPFEADYWLLATTAVCTYVQSIFDSVPLLLLVGPAGSGKSELSAAMSEVSANATMIGQVSAPTMMRLIDESGGLCVIDDLESIGVSGKNGQKKFTDLAQVLKVSYKKSTANRMITNPKTGKTEVMNFFGIKIVSNTKGVDDILGSRMIQIHTRHMDPTLLEEFKERERFDEDTLDHLKNMIHTWAFENTNLIYQTYQSLSQHHGDRETEIAMPLRVIAKLSEDEGIIRNLETALAAQKRRKNRQTNPSDMLKEIVDRLIEQGYQALSITHVMLEMRREMDPGYDIDYSKEMPGWSKQEWIGRKLREMGIVSDNVFRQRVKGKNLRFINLKKNYISSVIAKSKNPTQKSRAPDSFCHECMTCPFKHHQCEIAIERD